MSTSTRGSAGPQGLAVPGATAGGESLLPVDPFRSLHVHFGMLLGVEDFRTLDAYHRGKSWFHAAWAHGQGVIWGLGAGLSRGPAPEGGGEGPLTGELRVEPGAALDARGRELLLAEAACVDIPAWYAAHEADAGLAAARTVDEATGDVTFDAHVTVEFLACLDRQVPALAEPCDGGASTTAYSRVVETVRLCLRPGPAPDWRADAPGRFRRVRLLLGLEPAEEDPETPGTPTEADQAVLDARAEIAALPEAERPAACLARLRRFAVLDEIGMAPEQGGTDTGWNLMPVLAPAPVVLAEVRGIRLSPAESGWRLVEAEVDPFVRPVHMSTATIQELVCGCCGDFGASPVPGPGEEGPGGPGGGNGGGGGPGGGNGGGGGGPVDRTAAPAYGAPSIDPASVSLDGTRIVFTVSGPGLMASSVSARAIEVSTLDASGWTGRRVTGADYDAARGEVTVRLAAVPRGDVLRLIVRGTGPSPILGENALPLAGRSGGPPGSAHDGVDFVHQMKGAS